MRITLPVQLNPISRRKDRSIKISLETRELTPGEIMTLMALEGAEAWMALVPNQQDATQEQLPGTPAELGSKTSSERLRSALYVWYKQSVESQKFIGTFDLFYTQKMESIIEGVKSKLHD